MDALRWEFLGPALKNVILFCFVHSISIVGYTTKFYPGPWFTILSKKRIYTAHKLVFQFFSCTKDYLQPDWLGMVKYWLYCSLRSENSILRWEMFPKTKELWKNCRYENSSNKSSIQSCFHRAIIVTLLICIGRWPASSSVPDLHTFMENIS